MAMASMLPAAAVQYPEAYSATGREEGAQVSTGKGKGG